ncbi:MAG: hypothetical protein M3Q31_00355 [Actinomycetota bacterium]|nr:hypothetical protein [Actinomycetota bacterium]
MARHQYESFPERREVRVRRCGRHLGCGSEHLIPITPHEREVALVDDQGVGPIPMPHRVRPSLGEQLASLLLRRTQQRDRRRQVRVAVLGGLEELVTLQHLEALANYSDAIDLPEPRCRQPNHE